MCVCVCVCVCVGGWKSCCSRDCPGSGRGHYMGENWNISFLKSAYYDQRASERRSCLMGTMYYAIPIIQLYVHVIMALLKKKKSNSLYLI